MIICSETKQRMFRLVKATFITISPFHHLHLTIELCLMSSYRNIMGEILKKIRLMQHRLHELLSRMYKGAAKHREEND